MTRACLSVALVTTTSERGLNRQGAPKNLSPPWRSLPVGPEPRLRSSGISGRAGAPLGQHDAGDDQGPGDEVEGLEALAENEDRADGAEERDQIDEQAGPVGADEIDAAHVEHLTQDGR